MDPNRFDALVRSLGMSATRRRALAGLVTAALAGVTGRAAEAKRRRRRVGAQSHNNGGDHGGGTTRVRVCHKPGTPAEKTLEIDDNALDGHLGHGDHPGPCCRRGTSFCPESGTCERCCPRCGTCQSCVGGTCERDRDTTPCRVGDPPREGICCNGACRPGVRTCDECSPACVEPEFCRGGRCICPGSGQPCGRADKCCPVEGCVPREVPCICPGTGGPCPPELQCCPFADCRPADQPCPCPGSGMSGPCPSGRQCCPFVGCRPLGDPCPCPGTDGPCPPETHCCREGCVPREIPCRG